MVRTFPSSCNLENIVTASIMSAAVFVLVGSLILVKDSPLRDIRTPEMTASNWGWLREADNL